MGIVGRLHRPDGEFEVYCKAVLPRIKGLAISVTGDNADAEDVVIETLSRAFLRWPRLSKAQWRDGWVLRVAANLSIDLLRKRETAKQSSVGSPEVVAPEYSGPDFTEAIRTLPRRQQEVVVLRYYGDMSYADIARRLHISQGSVKTHLHRGLAAIRLEFGVDENLGGPHAEYTA